MTDYYTHHLTDSSDHMMWLSLITKSAYEYMHLRNTNYIVCNGVYLKSYLHA